MFELALFAVSFLAHVAILGWAARAFPRSWLAPDDAAARVRRRLLVAAAIAALVPVARRVLRRAPSDALGFVVALVAVELVAALFAMPLLVVVSGIAGLVGRLPGARPSPRGPAGAGAEPEASSPAEPSAAPAPAPTLSRRELVERGAGALVLAGTGVPLLLGVAGRRDVRLEEVPVRLVGLPRALDGYSILQWSDIHCGVFLGERELREACARIERARVDLVALTGDFVDGRAHEIDPLARAVAGLVGARAARDGVVAIAGNHDHYAGAGAVLGALERAGARTLVDDAFVLRPGDGGGFVIAGIDDVAAARFGGRAPRLNRTLARVPRDRPAVLLAHRPDVAELSAGQVALQLSGHTHGGQINPGNIARAVYAWVAGRYDVGGGTQLYVNRGFGTTGPPSRVAAPAELTRIVLVAA